MSADWQIFKLQLTALGGLLFFSLTVTWLILYYIRLLDHPNERSAHHLATPKCGGVGIVLSFVAGVFVSQLWGESFHKPYSCLYSLVLPVLLVALVSLADDIKELAPTFRLVVQSLAALLFLLMVDFFSRLTFPWAVNPLVVKGALSGLAFLWLIGMANAVNFMDGLDGLAAGQGLIAAFFFALIQIGQGNFFLGYVGFALAIGCLGFLAFNFPPAKVFMGDVGSVTIGFVLAALGLHYYLISQQPATLLLVPILMFNFLFDTILTFSLRLLKKEKVFKAHQDHFYQKFYRCGFSQRTVTMTGYGLAIIQGFIAILLEERVFPALLGCLLLQIPYVAFILFRFRSVRRADKATG